MAPRLIIVMGILFSWPSLLFAKTMYITDRVEIGVRSGTGLEYRILGRVKTGDRVDVLQSDQKWSKIKLADGTVGWINTSFLVDQIKSPVSGDLKTIEELQETVQTLSREKEALLQEKARLSQELQEAKAMTQNLQQEKMKRNGPEWSSLQSKNEQLEKEAALLKKRLSEQSDGGKGQRTREQLIWFSLGALVLLVGLLIGLIMGRSRRKTRRFY